MRKGISVLFFLLAIVSCKGPGSLSPAAYISYLENAENEYCKKTVIGSNEYTIQLAPAEYMVCKEIEPSDSSGRVIANRLKELEGHVFFMIKIGSTEKSRMQQGGKRISDEQVNVNDKVAYYDQYAAKDINLIAGGKLLSPSTYLFENNYDLSPYNTIVVGFETGPVPADLKITFNDRYTGIPAIRASFSKEQIIGLPKLSF
ncbi:MAG: hypothetical protein WC716_14905 [Chitinophagaceae bacterium]|jgi:hypothetical protein